MSVYYRPLLHCDAARPVDAVTVAGGWCWFTLAERLTRGEPPEIIDVNQIPRAIIAEIERPRIDLAGLCLDRPRLMGILNTTPDSFSDGGKFEQLPDAVAHGLKLQAAGADILDVGGESTRPGAKTVSVADEISRTQPVIESLRNSSRIAISIDTRKSAVADAAISAGATVINDVSALSFDSELTDIVVENNLPVCLMHTPGPPETMQDNPTYGDVLLDVYDYLSARIEYAQSRGIAKNRIIVDPGIGFGKTLEHNLTLIRSVALFHGLGCPILLGASRKRFIGTLTDQPDPENRVSGSIAVAFYGISQGVQVSRVHDIAETKQAITLWRATTGKGQNQ